MRWETKTGGRAARKAARERESMWSGASCYSCKRLALKLFGTTMSAALSSFLRLLCALSVCAIFSHGHIHGSTRLSGEGTKVLSKEAGTNGRQLPLQQTAAYQPFGDLRALKASEYTTLGHQHFPKYSVRVKRSHFCDGSVRSVPTL